MATDAWEVTRGYSASGVYRKFAGGGQFEVWSPVIYVGFENEFRPFTYITALRL